MDKLGRFDEILEEMKDLYTRKNRDYGNSFTKSFKSFGLTSPIIRLSDKLERLKSLNGGKVSLVEDESIEDTLIDLANYAVMALIEIRDFKEKTDAEVHKRLKRNNEEKSDDYIEFESIAKNYGDELRNYLKERDEY